MSLGYYVGLLQDPTRIDGMREGLARTVEPTDAVLEIGTGLGTYAFFAAQAGARHVWAVDRDPVIHVAEAIGRDSGLRDSIDFVRGSIPEVDLPEPIDLVVFEDYPVRFMDERVWRLLRDVSAKYLAPGARLFPSSGSLSLAPVGGPEVESIVAVAPAGRWEAEGVDWSALEPYLSNLPRNGSLPPDALLAEPIGSGPIDLMPPPSVDALAVEAEWVFEEPGLVRGLALWFDLDLGPGGIYSNEPSNDDSVWTQVLLPIVPPLDVPTGGTLVASVSRDALEDGAPGWLRWRAEVAGASRRGHELAGEPGTLEDLTKL